MVEKLLKETGWRFNLHANILNEVIGRYKQNRQFIVNITLMFDYLGRACRLLWNRRNAIHIFFNYNHVYKESYYRMLPEYFSEEKFSELVSYNKIEFDSIAETKKFIASFRGCENRNEDRYEIPRVRLLNDEVIKNLYNNKYFCNLGISKDSFDEINPIILVMDIDGANLGCILLYGKYMEEYKTRPFSDDAVGISAITNWVHKISNFLTLQADITNETYLPSYRCRHSTKAAILFGDITNFTQLSTMLRIIEANKGVRKVEQLGDILQKHCLEMSKIITEHNGRIERFIGDGLMAIFGEYNEDPIISVGNAVAAATRMVINFEKRQKEIQDVIYGEDGQNEINEMIEIDYALGINYGTVLFEYLGDDQHREYCCIGDHVSFASRLMHKASRFDPDSGEKWPPILISQTVEQFLKVLLRDDNWGINKEKAKLIIHMKGYGYPSYVYGIDPNLFDYQKYKHIIGKNI